MPQHPFGSSLHPYVLASLLRRVSDQAAVKTAWETDSCSGVQEGALFLVSSTFLGILGEESGYDPSAPTLPQSVTSYSLDSYFPGQAQLVLLNAVSWISSARFEANKGSDFPVILTHHWHLCISLLQSRTNTKASSPCTLCTKSLQV